MALTVGELAVELEAKTSDFKRKLDAAERRLNKFEDNATRRTKNIGASFRKMAGGVAKVGAAFTALAAVGAAAILVRISKSAIEASASFEQLEVRLATFLGSQEKATASLERFVEMSAKTPFAVGDIVEGATTLATVTGEDAEALEELTGVAANLAAVTGLDFPTAAGNLQRALASGLAAADLFKDKGVRQLLEKELDLVDATKLTAGVNGDLAKAFRVVFGEAGRYGNAAEALSDTLGGALSNVGDASERFKVAFGDALAPGVTVAAREVMIPFFDKLRGIVEENKDQITEFATAAIPKLFGWFAKLVKIAAVLVRGVGYLTVGFDFLQVVLAAVQAWLITIWTVFKTVANVFLLGATIIANGAKAIKAALKGNLVEAARFAKENERAWDSFKGKLVQAAHDINSAGNVIVDVAHEVGSNKEFFDKIADGIDAGADAAERMAANMGKLEKATKHAGEEADRQRPKFRPGGAEGLLPPIGGERPESILAQGEEFDLFEEQKKRERIEAIYRKGGLLGGEEGAELAGSFSQSLADSVVDGIAGALLELAGGTDMQTFAESLASLSEQYLRDAFDKVSEFFKEKLGKIMDDLEQKIPGISTAITAAIGIGLGLISGALRKTTATVTDAAIESAITSTAQVRGIVAGPTQIAIGQVATGIQDAFDPLLILDQERNRILTDLLLSVRAQTGAGAVITAAGAEVELAETSVTLG